MRVLIGIILGGVLTVGGAYVYDSHNALVAADAPAGVPDSYSEHVHLHMDLQVLGL